MKRTRGELFHNYTKFISPSNNNHFIEIYAILSSFFTQLNFLLYLPCQINRKVLDTLITSKTRIKLLVKFFLNSKSSSYLRNLETEFGESTNAIRLELNKFENAGLLQAHFDGNKKYFQANTKHPLFKDIHNIMLKHLGFDKIVDTVVKRLGNLEKVILTGAYAKGNQSEIIDLIFVGDDINKKNLLKLIDKAEKLIKRKIRYVVMKVDEFVEYRKKIEDGDVLLLWKKEE